MLKVHELHEFSRIKEIYFFKLSDCQNKKIRENSCNSWTNDSLIAQVLRSA